MGTNPHGHQPLLKRRQYGSFGYTSLGWSWEILAMSASVGCMVSIVVILMKMKDQPLSQWTFFLSLPATVAIFATASKSTAALAVAACISQSKWLHFSTATRILGDLDLFEEASRGPIGSLKLLATRPRGLASIGAVATVLALGLDVFIQQIIRFSPVDVARDDGNALFGLTHSYYAGAKLVGSSSATFGIEASTADMSMQGAIYRGLFDIDSPAVFNCTSRCYWNNTYISLGFTSSCKDVTDATLQTANSSSWRGIYGNGANLTTPGGVTLDATYSATSYQTVVSVGTISLLHVTNGDDGTITPGDLVTSDIVRIAALRVPSDHSNWILQPSKMEIVECDISLAAHSYSRMSASGNNFTIDKQDSFPIGLGLVTWNYPDPTNYLSLVFNQSGLPVLKASLADISALNVLFVSNRFNGTIYDGESPPSRPQGVGDVFRTGNMSRTLENMATSMTDQLRSSYNITARGLSIDQVVFVQVRWEWLILPLVVLLLSLLFLLLTLVRNSGTSVQLWKSSTVAILYHYLAWEDTDSTGILKTNVQSPSELEILAKSTPTKME